MREMTWDPFGCYETVWLCELPAEGQRFAVTYQTYNDDYTIRTIHSWRPVDAHEGPLIE